MNKRDSYFFLKLALLSLLLTIDFAGIWRSSETVSPNGILPTVEQREFLLKEYDTAVAEIHTRIEQEHDLFIHKLIFIGVVLGSISLAQTVKERKAILESGILHLCCWAAVAVAAIMDIRLMFNSVIIRDHGLWIKSLERLLLGQQSSLGWENYFSNNSVLWNSPVMLFVSADRQLLTAILFILALYLWVRHPHTADSSVFEWVNAWMACLCLALLALPEMYNGRGFLLNIVLLVIAIWSVARWSCMQATKAESKPETQKP